MYQAAIWQQRRSEGSNHNSNNFDPIRTPFDRDYSRLIHNSNFRRLQGKTQVLAPSTSDFIRTRLTHSLEVSQIALGLTKTLAYYLTNNSLQVLDHQLLVNKSPAQLKELTLTLQQLIPSTSLINTISLAHDIGHPPFGHSGEEVLNELMFDYGGFEGNAQTFRILSHTASYLKDYGLDFTRRSLLGVIKYPTLLANTQLSREEIELLRRDSYPSRKGIYSPSKGIYSDDSYIFDWVLEPLSINDRQEFTKVTTVKNQYFHSKKITEYKNFDCSIMELADDIAYGVHDLEDAIKLKLISRENFCYQLEKKYKPEEYHEIYKVLENLRVDDGSDATSLLDQIFNLRNSNTHKRAIGMLVHHLIMSSYIAEHPQFDEPLLRYYATIPDSHRKLLNLMKRCVSKYVIQSESINIERFNGQHMVRQVFDALASEPTLTKNTKHLKYSDSCFHRSICDYVSGMTNKYIEDLYQRLYNKRYS